MTAQWLESRWLGRVGLLACWPGSDLWIWFASGNFSEFHRSVLAGNLYGYWQWGCRESEVVKGGPSEANHVNIDHRMRTPSSLISKRPILQQMQRKLSNHTALCNYLCTRSISEQTLVKSGVMKTKNMSYTKRRTNSTVHDYNQNITKFNFTTLYTAIGCTRPWKKTTTNEQLIPMVTCILLLISKAALHSAVSALIKATCVKITTCNYPESHPTLRFLNRPVFRAWDFHAYD